MNDIKLSEVLLSNPDKLTELILNGDFPELREMMDCKQNNPHHDSDVWNHTLRVIKGVPAKEKLRLAALFHDSGKPATKQVLKDGYDHFYNHPKVGAELVRTYLSKSGYSEEDVEYISGLVLYHELRNPSKRVLRKWERLYGKEFVRDIYYLQIADIKGQSLYKRDEKLEEVNNLLAALDNSTSTEKES